MPFHSVDVYLYFTKHILHNVEDMQNYRSKKQAKKHFFMKTLKFCNKKRKLFMDGLSKYYYMPQGFFIEYYIFLRYSC